MTPRLRARKLAARCAQWYRETDNAAFVWLAIRELTRADVALPAWIVAYLAQAADAYVNSPHGAQLPPAGILAALALHPGRGPSKLTQAARHYEQACLASHVEGAQFFDALHGRPRSIQATARRLDLDTEAPPDAHRNAYYRQQRARIRPKRR